MKMEQQNEAKTEPVSLSIMNEDPTHLAGRLDEYATLSRERAPNLTHFVELELKEKFQALLKDMRSRPRLLKYCFNQVATTLNPRWSEKLYEARLERMFLEDPDLTPETEAVLADVELRGGHGSRRGIEDHLDAAVDHAVVMREHVIAGTEAERTRGSQPERASARIAAGSPHLRFCVAVARR